MLFVQSNLAVTYDNLGRFRESLPLKRAVYFGFLKLNGEEHGHTLTTALNYSSSLYGLQRFGEVKSLLRKMIPVARRALGESHELTLRMRWCYAIALYQDPAATLNDVREAVTTLEDGERIARRVLGGAHPVVSKMEASLQNARAALRARETPPPPGSA